MGVFKRKARAKKPSLGEEVRALKRISERTKNKASKEKQRGKRVIVHLGNIEDFGFINGKMVKAAKTRKYAERFPGIQFIGIDLRKLRARKPENLLQLQADFETGLKRLKNNSVDIISSEFAFGIFGKTNERKNILKGSYREYTNRVAKIAFRKLKPGGKLYITVSSSMRDLMENALRKAGFSRKNIRIRSLTKRELQRTYHSRVFREGLQITATK